MLRSDLKRTQILAIGFAFVSLVFAACGKGGGGSSPTPSPSPTPTSTISGSIFATPCAAVYVAYEPDGGGSTAAGGATFHGIQAVHYADTVANLCASQTNSMPTSVPFSSSVSAFAAAPDSSSAVAILQNTATGGDSLVGDVFGLVVGSLLAAGTPYDLATVATPVPTVAPTNGATAAPTPTPSPTAMPPLITDASSISVLGSSPLSVGLVVGPGTQSIVAVTSLTNAPPQYANSVPFSGPTYTLKNAPAFARSIVRANTDGSNNVTVLVRGAQDLLALAVTINSAPYQFDVVADDTTLGSGTLMRGTGNVAIDPVDSSRALIGGTSAGGGTTLTLVTGLPKSIAHATPLTMPGNIDSIAIDSSVGNYGYVATDVGIVVVKGIATGVLSIVPPFTATSVGGANVLPYTDCNGHAALLSHVSSVRVANNFLIALGSAPGTTCASGYASSVVAIPYLSSTGALPSPSPSPTAGATAAPNRFMQNNIITPPSAADYFLVR